MRQVLLNLLTNAKRHTPPDGEIHVRVAHDEGRVRIDVHNTGSSLTEEQQTHVFDRFYRADPARQRATGGTGLGLTIVKHLVEAHAGQIAVTSDATGVTFSVALAMIASEPVLSWGSSSRGSAEIYVHVPLKFQKRRSGPSRGVDDGRVYVQLGGTRGRCRR